MKKGICLNSEVSYVIAKLGHFDTLTIGDAGLPVPDGVLNCAVEGKEERTWR